MYFKIMLILMNFDFDVDDDDDVEKTKCVEQAASHLTCELTCTNSTKSRNHIFIRKIRNHRWSVLLMITDNPDDHR